MRRPKSFVIAIVALLAFAGAPGAYASAELTDDDEGGMQPDPPSIDDGDEEVNGMQAVTQTSSGTGGPTVQPLTLNGPGTNDGEDDGTPSQDLNESDGDEAL